MESVRWSRRVRLRRTSDDLDRAVVIAVIAVGMVQAPVHQKIDVVTVWHRLVAAVLAVAVPRFVGAAIRGGAAVGVSIADGNPVLVDVVFVRVVQMAVVQEIDVPLVPHSGVAAAPFMLVVVAFVNLVIVHLSPLPVVVYSSRG